MSKEAGHHTFIRKTQHLLNDNEEYSWNCYISHPSLCLNLNANFFTHPTSISLGWAYLYKKFYCRTFSLGLLERDIILKRFKMFSLNFFFLFLGRMSVSNKVSGKMKTCSYLSMICRVSDTYYASQSVLSLNSMRSKNKLFLKKSKHAKQDWLKQKVS